MKKDYDCVKEMRKIKEELSLRYWGHPEIFWADMEAVRRENKEFNWLPISDSFESKSLGGTINQLQTMTSAPESYVGHKPVIKKVDFSMRGHISIYLQDGRIVIAPLSKFPSIKKMSLEQRQKYGLADGNTIIFQHCDEVYHLQDFLGLPKDYVHS